MLVNLNWDMHNNNGIILNAKYPTGVLFRGVNRKPIIHELSEYLQFEYNEVRGIFKIAMLGDNSFRDMTNTEKSIIRNVAVNWVQLEGEEGNPNIDQLAAIKANEITSAFNITTKNTLNIITAYEPFTWIAQETEARAWSKDNSINTPVIDALLIGRAISGETKEIFISSIINKAEVFINYYIQLGKLQTCIKKIETARFQQDRTAIENIIWDYGDTIDD